VGDACSLAEPDDYFDIVRSERTLQWLADPGAAVAEMARVVRPGGRVSLIDTDWSTFAIDVGDDAVTAVVRDAMRTERGRPSNIGGRLHDVVRDAGLTPVARAEATHTWTAWNPDATPAPDGCFSMQSLADDLVATHRIAPAERDRFVSTIQQAARRDRFSMSLTMYAVVATRVTPRGLA
jgi:SAM-dependent methyltransferase